MMKVLCFLLFVIQAPVTWAFQWTSAGSLPNGTTIPACPGQDVTLSWRYTADVAEHLSNVEWYFTPSGGQETLLATQVVGNFFVVPGSSLSLQFLPNAGIRLHNVAIADAGTYSVHVNMEVHGVVDREVQTVEVQVSDQPITTDGQLHVTMLPDAVYVNSTRHYHVQLACGDFLPVWGHRASVVWTTPDNQTLSSTSDENGRFLLSVPNPVVSGEYSCAIDDTSPASMCVPSDSPLQRGATVNVDGVQAQFVIMEARMNSYQQENAALKEQLETQKTSSEQDITALKHQLETQKQQLETQKQQLETTRHNLMSMIETAARSVSFYAWLNDYGHTYNAVDTVVFERIVSNEGGAYSNSTGVFTVPVDGTYAFFVTITTDNSSPTKNTLVALYANNTLLSDAYSSYESGHLEPNSCQAVVFLKAGQRVFVRNYSSNSRYYPGHFTHFSGALLHAAMP